ncbi:MAG: GDSL-type esterase/lipase family protein [Methanopyri archaeon]|nr:GDSL-type esterase/lipase family protein [Methanopyri archaeon]
MSEKQHEKRNPSHRSGRETYVNRLILVLVSILVTLLLLELGARWFNAPLEPKQETISLRSTTDYGLGYELIPNSSFVHIYDSDPYGTLPHDLRITYLVNSWGLRGPERTLDNGEDVYRILVIGDSFTFGEGVAFENSFPAMLEEGLEENAPTDRRYQVINAGIPGYTIYQKTGLLMKLAPWIKPNMIILGFVLNDPITNQESTKRKGDDLIYSTQEGEGGEGLGSVLYDLIQRRSENRRDTQDVEEWYRSYYLGKGKMRWKKWSLRSIDQMTRYSKSQNITFMLAIFPLIHRLDDYPFRDIHELIASSCRERGIEVIDLLPVFENSTTSTLWVHPLDHHPNTKAHQMIADNLRVGIERRLSS